MPSCACLVGDRQKVGADPLPSLPIPPCPCPATPRFKVARGLGSYHEMFCQIKCKQMTCTVDMATKQPCTQRRQQHLTLPGWARICRKDQSSKVEDRISPPLPTYPEKQIYSSAPTGLLRKCGIHLLQDIFKFLGSSGQRERSSSAAHLLIHPYKAVQHLKLIFPTED